MQDDFRPVKRPVRSLDETNPAPQQPSIVAPDTNTERFRTPEEVAADLSVESAGAAQESNGAIVGEDSISTELPNDAGGGRWQKLKAKLKLSWPPGKKEWMVAGVVVLLIGGGTTLAMVLDQEPPPKPVAKKVVKPKTAPKPTTVPSTLSGLPVDPSINARPVIGVMVENSPDARPQSGLGQASVVFEAIAEGGITRFLALYQDTAPGDVGPIRSARPYYIQWLLGFDAAYAHVGGSPDALAIIKAGGVRDLDQFANAGSYHRIASRAAPHNVYTGIDTLTQLAIGKGYTGSTFTGFARKAAVTAETTPKAAATPETTAKKAAPASKSKKAATPAPTPPPAPAAKHIGIGLSGALYNVNYTYDPAANKYLRSLGGAPHMDAATNTQIAPTVVIALSMPYSLSGKYSVYQTIGSGQAHIFQDGGVTVGTWTKTADKSQFTFTDAAGQPVPLNPGTTWLTAVKSAPPSVSYTP